MAEIATIPWNGFTVASTFSGGGGSCCGYKMAGFKVIWANEFVPKAQETYRKNFPDTFLNCQDIREVTAEQALHEMGLEAGQLDLFDGSPPCQSFSMAGKRSAGWGKESEDTDGIVQRKEDLFFEYARLLKGIQPRVFIAENVKGLVSGAAKGYFIQIMKALRDCGYRVEARVLDAKWLGVPQSRQRVIFQGIRNDLSGTHTFPEPFPYFYSLNDAMAAVNGGGGLVFPGIVDSAKGIPFQGEVHAQSSQKLEGAGQSHTESGVNQINVISWPSGWKHKYPISGNNVCPSILRQCGSLGGSFGFVIYRK